MVSHIVMRVSPPPHPPHTHRHHHLHHLHHHRLRQELQSGCSDSREVALKNGEKAHKQERRESVCVFRMCLCMYVCMYVCVCLRCPVCMSVCACVYICAKKQLLYRLCDQCFVTQGRRVEGVSVQADRKNIRYASEFSQKISECKYKQTKKNTQAQQN